jgi:CHAT domain-containing protein
MAGWAAGEPVAPGDDGIVTADEIAALDLRATRLVVLSACDSGSGDIEAGEGVLGLRRGFLKAGARSLILTLWPVDDEATTAVMIDFYGRWRQTGSAPRALAVEQREWLQKLRMEQGMAEACRTAGPFILSFQGGEEMATHSSGLGPTESQSPQGHGSATAGWARRNLTFPESQRVGVE